MNLPKVKVSHFPQIFSKLIKGTWVSRWLEKADKNRMKLSEQAYIRLVLQAKNIFLSAFTEADSQ